MKYDHLNTFSALERKASALTLAAYETLSLAFRVASFQVTLADAKVHLKTIRQTFNVSWVGRYKQGSLEGSGTPVILADDAVPSESTRTYMPPTVQTIMFNWNGKPFPVVYIGQPLTTETLLQFSEDHQDSWPGATPLYWLDGIHLPSK